MMTTPEKLRRRQRREGWALVAMGVALSVTTLYNTHERNAQKDQFQECITEQITGLTASLKARSDLTDPRQKSISDLIDGIFAAKGDKVKAQDAVAAYKATQVRLAKIAKANEIPAFPNGKCD